MNKLLITRWNGRILTALRSEKRVVEIGLEEEDSILGNIYIGKVKRIVRNLNAAFVDFTEGRTGYYSFDDNPTVLYGDGRMGKSGNAAAKQQPKENGTSSGAKENQGLTGNGSAAMVGEGSSRKLREGDEIVVQVARDAVKTKDPVLTSNLNFTGKYAVVTSGKKGIGFSSRIADKEFKERLRPVLEEMAAGEVGIIVRTNAYGMEQELLGEIRCLMEQYRHIREKAAYRTCYSVLSKAEPEYLKTLKGCLNGSVEEIVTDDKEIYEGVKGYLEAEGQEAGVAAQVSGNQETGIQETGIQKSRDFISGAMPGLRFYQDPLVSLNKLYSLDTAMEQALQRKVWLKSGGYLVIEITEAMVVVDVNTGKYSGRKDLPETIRMINLEAAEEICCQLRLRNLSGIILVDFIDMHVEADKEALMDTLRRFARQDSVKTTVVDMTQLNLVEMTRKRQKRPLWEQVAAVKER